MEMPDKEGALFAPRRSAILRENMRTSHAIARFAWKCITRASCFFAAEAGRIARTLHAIAHFSMKMRGRFTPERDSARKYEDSPRENARTLHTRTRFCANLHRLFLRVCKTGLAWVQRPTYHPLLISFQPIDSFLALAMFWSARRVRSIIHQSETIRILQRPQ